MNIGDMPPTFFKVYWLAWIIIGFGVMEFYAIRTGQVEGTFSYFVWWIVGAGDGDRDLFRWAARVFVVGLLIWLIPHLLNRWEWFS